MEPPETMDTTPEPSKLQMTTLGTDELPNDEEIKEAIQEIHASSTGDIDSDDLSSDCDSDVEGLELMWDALLRSNEPYGNTVEHLTKLLEHLPSRYSTRVRNCTLNDVYDKRVLDKKELKQLDNMMKSRLVEPGIDPEILMENLGRMRVHIKQIIKKKKRAAHKLSKEQQGNNTND